MNISFDFDNTLQNPTLQAMAKVWWKNHNRLFIITSRLEKFDNSDVFEVARAIGISIDSVIFTNGQSKKEAIKLNQIDVHFEDCPFECEELKGLTKVVQVVPFILEGS